MHRNLDFAPPINAVINDEAFFEIAFIKNI